MSELADAKNIEKVRLCKDTTFAWCMMVCAHSHRAPALFVKCTLFFLFFFRQAEIRTRHTRRAHWGSVTHCVAVQLPAVSAHDCCLQGS